MPRQRLREAWFPLSCTYYQNGKVRDGGPAAALCHQYLLAINQMRGGPDDGSQPIEEWEPLKIHRWLGVLQGKISRDEIKDGMLSAETVGLVERVVVDAVELVRPHDYEDFSFGVAKDAAADRRARERRTKSGQDGDSVATVSQLVATPVTSGDKCPLNLTETNLKEPNSPDYARAGLQEEYEYTGELETKTQRIVALAMGTFKHWSQLDTEANIPKMMGFCPEFTLENWKEVLHEADKYTEVKDRYMSPYRVIVGKIKWLQAKLKGRAGEAPKWDPEIDPLKQGWTYFLPLGMCRPFNGGQVEALAYSKENDPPEKYAWYKKTIEEFNAKRAARAGN